jgi:hypothetical protein
MLCFFGRVGAVIAIEQMGQSGRRLGRFNDRFTQQVEAFATPGADKNAADSSRRPLSWTAAISS